MAAVSSQPRIAWITTTPASRVIFALIIRQQIQDSERQERVVRDSGLDWTIVQPVYLTDDDEPAARSTTGEVQGMKVSRRAVGAVLAELATGTAEVDSHVTLSGAVAGAVPVAP